MHGRGAQRGVKGDVVVLAVGGAGLHITSALTVGARARTAAGLPARDLVDLRLQLTRGELDVTIDLLAAFPPVAFLRALKRILRRGLHIFDVGILLSVPGFRYRLTFLPSAASC